MSTEQFEATVRVVRGVPVIDLRGDVDSRSGPAIDAAYDAAAQEGAERILLNFAEASYINSTGIALIVGLLGRARAAHLEVLVCSLSEHYRHIFEITRLAEFMSVHDDEASAIAVASLSR